MTEYTPTIQSVRDGYVWLSAEDNPVARELAGEDFDRFLTRVRREAEAEALREAADDIDLDLGRGYTGADDHDATAAAEVWLRDRAEQIKKEDPR